MKFNRNSKEVLKKTLKTLDKVNFADLPTALHEAPNFSKELGGPRIFFKREDLTGMAFGGNKTRMFDYLMGKIKKEGYDSVVAGAAVQSNYCRQMTAACAKLGIDCYLFLRPVRGEKDYIIQGNLLLDLLMGADVKILQEDSQEYQRKKAENFAEKLRNQGRNPYVARPIDDSDLGIEACGYVDCLLEIAEQTEKMDISLDYLYAATLDTTQAGLLFAAKYIDADLDIIGINPIDTEFLAQTPENAIMRICNQISNTLNIDLDINKDYIHSYSDYIGEGYGMITEECREAIKLVARTEGILLDPVYSGKAMAGLIDHIEKGYFNDNDTILFMHTGGNSALFAYAEELGVTL